MTLRQPFWGRIDFGEVRLGYDQDFTHAAIGIGETDIYLTWDQMQMVLSLIKSANHCREVERAGDKP